MERFKQLPFIAGLLFFTPFAFADDFDPYFEFIVMGGIATVDTENTSIQVTESETDKLVQNSGADWNTKTVQLGFGYAYALTQWSTGNIDWFSKINPQVNLYQLASADINGDVWLFENPDYNQANYHYSFQSLRTMFDVAITVAQYQQLSAYVLGGLGAAWNEVSDFSATAKEGMDCPINGLNLYGTQSSSGFAYEFGAGLTYDIAKGHAAVSLEWLYSGLNNVKMIEGSTAGFDIESNKMDVSTQAVMLGLRFVL